MSPVDKFIVRYKYVTYLLQYDESMVRPVTRNEKSIKTRDVSSVKFESHHCIISSLRDAKTSPNTASLTVFLTVLPPDKRVYP